MWCIIPCHQSRLRGVSQLLGRGLAARELLPSHTSLLAFRCYSLKGGAVALQVAHLSTEVAGSRIFYRVPGSMDFLPSGSGV